MGIILRLIREIYFKMKISALIFSAASAQYAETTTTPAPVTTPEPAPVETYNCFPANGDGVTPCGCQWNTLETFENKTCTVKFGDSGANILQFQAHGGWTQGNYGGAQGTYIFHGIDGMSAELLNMNWFFSLESGECCNDEMPLKEDGSCYYNKTMNPPEWEPVVECVDNAGAYPTPVFSAFNSNWRPQTATTSRSSDLPVTSLLALSSSTTELLSVTPPSVVSPLLLLPEVMSQPFSTSIPPPTRNKSRPTLQKTAVSQTPSTASSLRHKHPVYLLFHHFCSRSVVS